jgi:oligopeptide/dipeptide ABC transporter ATP-binding protein
MYAGKIVELAETEELFASPRHPYTNALLSAIPEVDEIEDRGERILLHGDVPSPIQPPSGCRFHPRCPKARAHCEEAEPPFEPDGHGRLVACHYPVEPGELLRAREAAAG